MDDVAKAAGVSKGSVSKVIRNAYGLSPAMRKRVETAITELGYRPSIAARAMRGSSFSIGMEIPNLGAEEYKLLIDIILLKPATSRFIAYKLVQQFAYQPTSRDMINDPDPLVSEVAAVLRNSGWSIKEAVKTMLNSDRFRSASPALGNQLVRSPIELVAHACKAAGVAANNPTLYNTLARAGQQPFRPPNVGGWPVGKAWVSPTTVMARYDLAVQAAGIHAGKPPEAQPLMFPAVADIDTGGAAWAEYMGLAAFSATTLSALRAYLVARRRTGVTEFELQTGLFALICTSPDWQVM